MEWIDGAPLDRWAAVGTNGRRPLRELLDVFLQICDGVHHAHQRGVIHRDLKPGNVLVVEPDDGTPDRADQALRRGAKPKILDFGLAKLSAENGAAARLTATSGFIGTPAYAAPEQLASGGGDVDVRTDVYALGALLYEMATGRLPYATEGGMPALFDAIRRTDPPAPSRVADGLDGELDAIVLKALAKEPQRRYASVDALAADVRRYLVHEPLEARRGQRWYAVRKFAQRNQAALAIAGAFVVLICGAAAALSVMYARQGRVLAQVRDARDAEAAARREAQRTQAALERLLLQVADAGKGADLELRRGLLAGAVQMVEAELHDTPRARRAALTAIGKMYQRLALYDDGEAVLRAALELAVGLDGRDSPAAATSINDLAELLQARSRYAAAEPLFREALAIRSRTLGPDDPDVAQSRHNLGTVLSNRQDYAAALELYEQALAARRRSGGPLHAATIRSLSAVGCTQMNLGRYAVAEPLLREALAAAEVVFGPEDRETAGRHVDVGKALLAQGRLDEAEEHLRRGLELFRAALGDRHDDTAWAAHRLGTLLLARGRAVEAEPLVREALATYRQVLGADDPYVASACESLAAVLTDLGRAGEAAAWSAEAARIRELTDPARWGR
jgi:tetratricopeptide (TPR) repeat protein